MPVQLTKNARLSAQALRKKPSIIIQFDGIDTIFGSSEALRVIRIGDPDLYIGDDWRIGIPKSVRDQETVLTFNSDFGATSTKIEYTLNPDKGIGGSVSSLTFAFVDNEADDILTIFTDNEMLGRKCRVWLSPDGDNTSFPEDYIVIFRGIVDSLEAHAGGVLLNISHPDQKKRQTLFNTFETELNGSINNSTTSITLLSTTGLLTPVNGPTGSNDTSLKFYIRIDDEIIRYTGVSGSSLTGVSRAQLGTVANSHNDEASVKSFYTLEGNAIDLALKLMLSGWNTYYKTGVQLNSVEEISSELNVPNSILFRNTDLNEEYGLTVGDYVTVSGCTNGANNVTLKEITDIIDTGNANYIVVDDVSFVTENDPPSGAVVAFRSKYDTLGEGLQMSPDEVDVTEHENLKSLFLSAFNYNFYLKDTVDNVKDFLEKEIYAPIACYSLPKDARSSVGYHIGPLPTTEVPTLNEKNVKDPSKISKMRSLGKNFYNTIIYKYDQDSIEDKFLKGEVYTNATSRAQIPVGTKSFIIESLGLRDGSTAQSSANRRLNRYAFAAEYFTSIKVLFKVGFNVDLGDLVILDGTNLKIADFDTGHRGSEAKLYQVISKSFDIRTGDISFGLVNTNYSTANRYALISPASYVKAGASSTQFTIKSSFDSKYDEDEYLKWNRFLEAEDSELVIRVRNSSYSVSATASVDRFQGNTVYLNESLGFTPSADMLMEFAGYPQASTNIKLIYGFISEDASGFSNGDDPYRML